MFELKNLLALSLVSSQTAAVAHQNVFWKKFLAEKFCIPIHLLDHPIWNKNPKIFRSLYIQISKYEHTDFFVMNPHRQNFPHLIFLLAFSGAVQLLQEYCENNVCDFLMEDDKGRNILHYAALSNQPECLNWLLTKNIPISSNNKYCWLLNTASIGGNLSMIKKAADLQQTNLDACDSQNRNAIYLATLSGNFEAVDHLLSLKKISPRLISFITKMNCLHIAAGKGDEKLFMLLAGTNQFRLSDIDCFNRNVLHHAYKGKCKTIINFVESHSKSLQMVRDSFGWIPQRYLTGVPDKKLAKKNPGDPVRQQNLQRKYFDSEDRAAGQEFAKR